MTTIATTPLLKRSKTLASWSQLGLKWTDIINVSARLYQQLAVLLPIQLAIIEEANFHRKWSDAKVLARGRLDELSTEARAFVLAQLRDSETASSPPASPPPASPPHLRQPPPPQNCSSSTTQAYKQFRTAYSKGVKAKVEVDNHNVTQATLTFQLRHATRKLESHLETTKQVIDNANRRLDEVDKVTKSLHTT